MIATAIIAKKLRYKEDSASFRFTLYDAVEVLSDVKINDEVGVGDNFFNTKAITSMF